MLTIVELRNIYKFFSMNPKLVDDFLGKLINFELFNNSNYTKETLINISQINTLLKSVIFIIKHNKNKIIAMTGYCHLDILPDKKMYINMYDKNFNGLKILGVICEDINDWQELFLNIIQRNFGIYEMLLASANMKNSINKLYNNNMILCNKINNMNIYKYYMKK